MCCQPLGMFQAGSCFLHQGFWAVWFVLLQTGRPLDAASQALRRNVMPAQHAVRSGVRCVLISTCFSAANEGPHLEAADEALRGHVIHPQHAVRARVHQCCRAVLQRSAHLAWCTMLGPAMFVV